MYCTRCGTKNPDTSLNCFNCGESMNAPRSERTVATGSVAAAPQKDRAPKILSRVEIGHNPLIITEKEILFGPQHMKCDEVLGIRYGVYKHYINGIRSSQSYAVWLTDNRSDILIECATGTFVRTATIETRYQETLKALYPVVIVPIIQSFLMNLDKGNAFQIGNVTFDKNGLHRSQSFGTIEKGLLRAWVSIAGGKSLQQREHEHQHLAWSSFGGHSFAEGNIRLLSKAGDCWVQFPLRDTWNAVCLGPLFDFLYEEGRLWTFVNR